MDNEIFSILHKKNSVKYKPLQALSQRGYGEEDYSPAPLDQPEQVYFAQNREQACLFWCYASNYRSEEFFVLSLLCRKVIPQDNFWFQKGAQLVAQIFKPLIQWTRLTAKSRYHLKIGLIWRHHPSRFSLQKSTFPRKIQAHTLLQTQPLLQPRTCLPPKTKKAKLLNVPIT